MSVFHDVRLPLSLALGASGGPERRTEIVTLASGLEVRNSPWAGSRRRYDISGAVRSLDDVHSLLSFFEARRGALHAFRFRDFLDHKSTYPSLAVTPTDQPLGVGDGEKADFQLLKAYGDEAGAYQRAITKPIAASVRVAVDGQELIDGYSVNLLTGIVHFQAPPALGAALTAGYEFDVPVRFETSRIEASLEAHKAGRIGQVALIEVFDA